MSTTRRLAGVVTPVRIVHIVRNGVGIDAEGRLWEVPMDYSKEAMRRQAVDDLADWMVAEVMSGRDPKDIVAELKRKAEE